MRKRSVRDLDPRGRRVLLRVDFNVPLRDGAVADDGRIRSALPTLRYLLDQGAAVIVCSHLGRPAGEVREDLRMAPVAAHLSELLGCTVATAPDCVGRAVERKAKRLQPGDVLLLENLRFHREEEANAPKFAARLARLADLYVNDAFGTAHRAHASTEGVAHLLPAAAGLLMEQEIAHLANLLDTDTGKLVVVSGGAKVGEKLDLLHTFAKRATALCIGGAMANTFLLAQGTSVGTSLAEPDKTEEVTTLLATAARHRCQALLPLDAVIAQGPDQPPRARPIVFAEEQVPDGWSIFDIGPRTVKRFGDALAEADTAIWNGPLGLFEREAFAGGTRALALNFVKLNAKTIVCGGETLQAIHEAGVTDRLTHVSTGGAAAWQLLEGRTLPGLAALPDAAAAPALG